MTCLFDTEVEIGFDFDYLKLYERAVEAVLTAEGCSTDISVSLLMTDDESIRQINRDNRDLDEATDVLSFPMLEFDAPSDFDNIGNEPWDVDPESGELLLGDMVISQDHVVAQARQYGHDVQREFAFLIVHSMLHLCGYDHIEESDRELMEERQKIIMESLYNDFPKLVV